MGYMITDVKPAAYSYIRFSTPDQIKGDSLRRQAEKSAAYAEQHGLYLDTSITIHDLGISAYDRSNITKGALGGFLFAHLADPVQTAEPHLMADSIS